MYLVAGNSTLLLRTNAQISLRIRTVLSASRSIKYNLCKAIAKPASSKNYFFRIKQFDRRNMSIVGPEASSIMRVLAERSLIGTYLYS